MRFPLRPALLVLVAAAESDPSEAEALVGWSDAPLSASGEEQARLLAERLSELEPTSVFSSPLRRALQTAGPVARLKRWEVRIVQELRERSYGVWEGRELEEVRARWPELWEAWRKEPDRPPPGGEGFEELVGRVSSFLAECASMGGTVLACTHSGPVRAAVAVALGLEPRKAFCLKVSPASITILELGQEGMSVVALNDRCHLPGEAGLPWFG